MRIAVYGGSFDPVHVVHEQVARDATKRFDKVLVVPAFRHALKPDGFVGSFATRVRMLDVVFDGEDKIEVSTIAQVLWDNQQSTYSYDLLTLLKANLPESSLKLLVGSDILKEASRWHLWKEINRDFGVQVVGREGSVQDGLITSKTYPDISATEIRSRLAEGRSVSGMVSPKVREYLRLYKTQGAGGPPP